VAVPRETEVKLRVRDLAAVRETLKRAGAELVRARHLEDNVLFDDPLGSLQSQGCVLRLRRTPDGGLLTFKGPRRVAAGVKSREELQTAVADPDALDGILTRLGYRPIFRYQKYRESFRHRSQSVEVDETPIGAFVEIEGDLEGIALVAAELGYAPADYVGDSYVGLFFAAGGEGDMLFEEPVS
jgi:adenylate cyclase class 2